MLLETKMLEYIFTFFFILFQQSPHTTSFKIYAERSLFFMYYLLNERQLKAYIHTYVTRTFLTCNVLKGSGFIQEMNYSIKLCTSLPSIFMTGVHPPSPHPKFPMWQKTDNGWESTRRVTTPLTLDLLNQNEKKKRRNTTSNENNDGEIKLEVLKIIFKATVAMIMGKILIDNNDNNNNNNNNNNNSNDSKISKWKVDPSDVNICGI